MYIFRFFCWRCCVLFPLFICLNFYVAHLCLRLALSIYARWARESFEIVVIREGCIT